MDHRVCFPCDSDRAIRFLERDLAHRGLTTLRSFEIRGSDGKSCRCGSPGGRPCGCHFAVLLVFGTRGEPAVVTARGSLGEATLELANHPNNFVAADLTAKTLEALHAAVADARNGRPGLGA